MASRLQTRRRSGLGFRLEVLRFQGTEQGEAFLPGSLEGLGGRDGGGWDRVSSMLPPQTHAAWGFVHGILPDSGNSGLLIRMALLETPVIQDQMRTIPSWSLQDGRIQRVYEFPDFVAAMVFVNAIALHAEAVQHHPDIDIRWNRVTLTLTTHDAGGLTLKDFEVARQADGIAG